MNPHQHGGGLFPGGKGVGLKAVASRAPHDAQVVGHGDESTVYRHVGEGDAVAVRGPGQGGVPQAPHQHGGHLPPGQLLLGAEGVAGGGHRVVGQDGLHGGVVPAAGRHVGVGGLSGADLLPAEQPGEGGGESRTGDRAAQTELAAAYTLEEAQLCGPGHIRGGPVVFGDIGVAPGGLRLGQEAQSQQSCQQPYHETFFHKSLLAS